jgi:hypothetical protein
MTGTGRDRLNGRTRPARTEPGRDRPNGQTRPAPTGPGRDRPNGQTRPAQTGTTRPAQTGPGRDRLTGQTRPAQTGTTRPAQTERGPDRPNEQTRHAMACWASDRCDSDRAASVPPGRPESSATKRTRAIRRTERPSSQIVSGDVLLSHAVARAVPSALRGLASGFGMGPGVSLSLWSPKLYGDICPSPWRARTVPREPHSGRVLECGVKPLSKRYVASPRPISTGQLHALPHFHFRPINPVV